MESELITSSNLFSFLAAKHPGVEVWHDEDFNECGWTYFWIVSHDGDAVRNLAYVRVQHGNLEQRTYDAAGDDLWIAGD